jgi:hypothetical protein
MAEAGPVLDCAVEYVLLVEIIQHRYRVNSWRGNSDSIPGLRGAVVRAPGKQAALQYLDEFEGKFWVDADRARSRDNQIPSPSGSKRMGRISPKVGARFPPPQRPDELQKSSTEGQL